MIGLSKMLMVLCEAQSAEITAEMWVRESKIRITFFLKISSDFDDMNLLKNEKVPSKEVIQLNGEHEQKCTSSFSRYQNGISIISYTTFP